MAVGIAAITVETAIGSIETLDYSRRLQCFEILVDGCMSDAATAGIEMVIDIASAEVCPFFPEEFKHHSPLTAESHSKLPAALKHITQTLRRIGDGGGEWGQGAKG